MKVDKQDLEAILSDYIERSMYVSAEDGQPKCWHCFSFEEDGEHAHMCLAGEASKLLAALKRGETIEVQ